ncbi:hypothetical protein DERF_014273 [Dermatophagoides farinae]|uniref:Uncharacterized protein n=1 Tax=Dermatophagoides farinae TaxID=6954 RepID=A0A922HLJ2_DERFA|nr:hypothetical protein DERF_014273 [Dermatophagoides farinae]
MVGFNQESQPSHPFKFYTTQCKQQLIDIVETAFRIQRHVKTGLETSISNHRQTQFIYSRRRTFINQFIRRRFRPETITPSNQRLDGHLSPAQSYGRPNHLIERGLASSARNAPKLVAEKTKEQSPKRSISVVVGCKR